jgi:hypothetical protein
MGLKMKRKMATVNDPNLKRVLTRIMMANLALQRTRGHLRTTKPMLL